MAVAIRAWVAWEVQIDSSVYRGGSLQQPAVNFGSNGLAVHDRKIQAGASSTVTLLDTSLAGEPSTYNFLYLESDQPVMIELQGTTTADNSHFQLAAGVPLMFAADDTRAAGANFAGALQVVKKILARNDSGLVTANIRCFALL